MVGLPHSGTSTLLMGLLKREKPIDDNNDLHIYETVLMNDSVMGKPELIDLMDYDDCDDAMILLSIAKFLTIKNYQPLPEFSSIFLKETYFKQDLVDRYFKEFCEKLFMMMKDIENPQDTLKSRALKASLTRSHGFVSFFDINANKAAYEIVFILGSSHSSVMLFNVLNLFHYTREKLMSPLDLSDEATYHGKYKGEDVHLFKLHTALEYFVHTTEAR